MYKILIVDDCPQYTSWFVKKFSSEFKVDVNLASQLLDLSSPFVPSDYDALLIDLFMPEVDGFSLWCQLKEKYKNMPRSFLISESNQSQYREMALRLEFDDYLHKEMSVTEIVLRVKNRIRLLDSRTDVKKNRIKLGSMEFVLTDMTCRLPDEVISLTKTEFRILQEVAKSSSRKISRQNLMDSVWPDKVVVKQTLNTHIFNLNEKLCQWEYFLTIDKEEMVLFKSR